MGFGGPVWHASARAETEAVAWAMAEQALGSVGDSHLGEWRERGMTTTMHLRRRLTAAERQPRNLGVRDIRGTIEEERRLAKLVKAAPHLRGLIGHAR